MIVNEYFIENRWFSLPQVGNLLIDARHREIDSANIQRTIIQVVRPPRHLQLASSIKLREAWDANVHFPSIWRARPGIYKDPHVIVATPENIIAIKAKHMQPHAANCRYVALVEREDDSLMMALSNHHPTGPNIIGVFRRCE